MAVKFRVGLWANSSLQSLHRGLRLAARLPFLVGASFNGRSKGILVFEQYVVRVELAEKIFGERAFGELFLF